MDVFMAKEPVSAYRFAPTLNLEGARTAILHTRWATKGATTNNLNNHPIDVHGIVGVHNGVLNNDDAIFDLLGSERFGEVDSEAAFALLNHANELSVTDRLTLLDGSAALAWLTVDDEGKSDRVLHLARVRHSPLWLGQTAAGSTVFGSTLRTIQAGASAMKATLVFQHVVEEGTYIQVRRGVIQEWADIPRPTPVVSASKKALTKAERMWSA